MSADMSAKKQLHNPPRCKTLFARSLLSNSTAHRRGMMRLSQDSDSDAALTDLMPLTSSADCCKGRERPFCCEVAYHPARDEAGFTHRTLCL